MSATWSRSISLPFPPLACVQNPFAERLIGSARRECLDHVLILSERHLRHILTGYFAYYHGARTHLSLDKDAPDVRPIERPEAGPVVPIPEVGGLHHRYSGGQHNPGRPRPTATTSPRPGLSSRPAAIQPTLRSIFPDSSVGRESSNRQGESPTRFWRETPVGGHGIEEDDAP